MHFLPPILSLGFRYDHATSHSITKISPASFSPRNLLMEAANAAIATVIANTNHVAADVVLPKQLKGKSNKKKVNVLKAALLTLFGRSRKTTKCVQAEVLTDANNWAMLVGCMRPMSQLQDKDSTLMMQPDAKSDKEKQIVVVEEEDDVNQLPGSSSSSECGGDSRYASALNLQELDKNGSSDDEEEFDDTHGDAMIDMKAEMFIAQFYAQMRIQNDDVTTS